MSDSRVLTAEHVLVPHSWRRQISLLRLLLGLSCLAAFFTYPTPATPVLAVIYGFYVVYAVGILLIRRLEQASYSLFSLVLDAAFFLISTLHPEPRLVWLSLIFYFYLLLVAALLHEWQKVGVLIGICLLFLLVLQPAQFTLLWPIVLMGGMLALVLTMYKRSLQERLSAALRRAVLSRSEAEIARTTERERIAADFHDGPLQSFISFQMRLEIVRRLMAKDVQLAYKELTQLQELCRIQVADLRTFVKSMRPAEMDGANLHASLRQMLRTFQNDTGISSNLQGKEFAALPNTETAGEILQVVREALNNVQKHSRASRVQVSAAQMDNKVELRVEDDGHGFPFSGAYSMEELDLLRLGPVSIKRRVRNLKGDLNIDSRPGRGSTLTLRIPV